LFPIEGRFLDHRACFIAIWRRSGRGYLQSILVGETASPPLGRETLAQIPADQPKEANQLNVKLLKPREDVGIALSSEHETILLVTLHSNPGITLVCFQFFSGI
jgi:hypothetical protein